MVSFITDALLLKYQVMIHFNKLFFFFDKYHVEQMQVVDSYKMLHIMQ